jgi:iron complex outermembrane receptor protein
MEISNMRQSFVLPALASLLPAIAAADHTEVEEVLVVAERETRIYELAETLDIVPDSAALLKKAVGANVVVNGPLTGIAQYRGMSRMRVASRINGAVISPGGPNWMDPPLSYAPAAYLESLEVHRGIAPVSAGQETIGGVVNANTWSGDFAEQGLDVSGRLRAGGQSGNEGTLVSAGIVIANPNHRLKLSGLTESGDDAEFADGEVIPTEYERDRVDMGYGFQTGAHAFQVDYARNETGDTGTPALPMDIQWIDSDLYGVGYVYDGASTRLRGKAYYNDIDHGMSNFHLRTAPMDTGMYRRNIANGESYGFSLAAEFSNWTVGIDAHTEEHNAQIDNPTPGNGMFFVTGFNDAERRVLGVFAERQLPFGDGWLGELGIRYNHVDMDSDTVNATPAIIGMPPAVALRAGFNNADRNPSDDNVDWVAKLYYLVNPELSLYGGASRKTRSPSYQERYLWLPLQATAGFADGMTYTGRIDLDPEVAHELELGVDWQHDRFTFSPRVFYRDVKDYIQGTVSTNTAAIMFVRMMNTLNGTNNPDPLEFNNVDAKLWGADVDWSYTMTARWSLDGVVNYVRGERDDINDNLYRIAPLNAFVAFNYQQENWGASLETFLYDEQDKVSETNMETETDGYALFHVKGYWTITDGLRLSLGVENLADEDFEDHLGGINRVRGNPDIAVGERLPGYGRSFFARVDYAW